MCPKAIFYTNLCLFKAVAKQQERRPHRCVYDGRRVLVAADHRHCFLIQRQDQLAQFGNSVYRFLNVLGLREFLQPTKNEAKSLLKLQLFAEIRHSINLND